MRHKSAKPCTSHALFRECYCTENLKNDPTNICSDFSNEKLAFCCKNVLGEDNRLFLKTMVCCFYWSFCYFKKALGGHLEER